MNEHERVRLLTERLDRLIRETQAEGMPPTDDENGRRVSPQYPDGRYGRTDEGGMLSAVGVDRHNGRIILAYETPVVWVGMDPAGAMDLARKLAQAAVALVRAGQGGEETRAEPDPPGIGGPGTPDPA